MGTKCDWVPVHRIGSTDPFETGECLREWGLHAVTRLAAQRQRELVHQVHPSSRLLKCAHFQHFLPDLGFGNRFGRPEANRVAADAFAANVLPIVRQLQAAGITSTYAIADALNARGIRTARGADWHHSTVRNLLARV